MHTVKIIERYILVWEMAKFNRIKYIETALLRSNGELYTSPMTQLQK